MMTLAALHLERFGDVALAEQDLLARLSWLRDRVAPRLERFLGYYRNPMTELSSVMPCPPGATFMVRPWRQYQEIGLPARITGFRRGADGAALATGSVDVQRKEVVIENDIAWRMDTLVDFVARRVPAISSTARSAGDRAALGAAIGAILNGGAAERRGADVLRLLQELVLQGALCGSAWVHLRPTPALLARLRGNTGATLGPEHCLALEVLDARHVCAWGGPRGYAAILHDVPAEAQTTRGLWDRVKGWLGRSAGEPALEDFSFDLLGVDRWQRYQRGVLVEEGDNPLGMLPLVRFENAADPAAGTRVGHAGSAVVDPGIGDVEPLMPLQDELNTRLSDRAYRVTMTSFRMYLGKGIEDFIKRPIGPGQMWGTDNLDAEITSFGGDAAAPSEESHINEVREALDKISGVSPVAAGLIRGKLGNLTSAIALRLTLIALLARTERKRAGLTQTLEEIARKGLAILAKAGVVASEEADRGIDVNWPTPLPESDMDRLEEARAKLALGVPRDVVLTELGYGELTLAPEKPDGVPVAQGQAGAAAPPAPGAA